PCCARSTTWAGTSSTSAGPATGTTSSGGSTPPGPRSWMPTARSTEGSCARSSSRRPATSSSTPPSSSPRGSTHRGRGCAGSWSTMAELDLEYFFPDVVDTPAFLHLLVNAHGGIEPLALQAKRVLFIGMGSSRYAALNAAAYLRSLGCDAHAEHASSGAPQPPDQGLLVVAISAGGGSAETIAAARRHRGTSTVVGVTNRPDGALAAEVDTCLDLHA